MLSLLQILGSIAAPVTAATALLYYFGWVRAHFMYNYFGVDVALLGFTTADYLLRSITPMFLPLAAGALAAVLMLQVHPRIKDALRRRGDPVATAAPWLVALVGSAIIVWSAAIIRVHDRLPRSDIQVTPYVLAPLGLGVGLGLIVWGLYLRRELHERDLPAPTKRLPAWSQVAQATLIVVLLALAAVWTVANYADATGAGTAHGIAYCPERQPGAIIYSQRRLQITTASVNEQRLPDPQGSYKYRYVGLRLLAANEDSLFLISGIGPQSQTTLMLPRSGTDVRVEWPDRLPQAVFGASERPEARTMDDDGLLLHAELAIGNATIMFGERKPDWAGDAAAGGAEEWDQASPELTYIHETLLTAMRQLQDPR